MRGPRLPTCSQLYSLFPFLTRPTTGSGVGGTKGIIYTQYSCDDFKQRIRGVDVGVLAFAAIIVRSI